MYKKWNSNKKKHRKKLRYLEIHKLFKNSTQKNAIIEKRKLSNIFQNILPSNLPICKNQPGGKFIKKKLSIVAL